MDFVKVAILCSIDGFSVRGLPTCGVGTKGKGEFADIDILTLVGCSDQLLVILEFAAACDAVDLLSRVMFLLIRARRCVACSDFRERSVRMMHVLDDIFAGHGGQKLDFGEIGSSR